SSTGNLCFESASVALRPLVLGFAAVGIFCVGTAFAGASPKPPPPPEVSFAALPASATVQQKQPDGKLNPIRARLLSDHARVAPGDTLRLGVYLEQNKGWHTYYKSPGGEIGLPTTIEWTLPEGGTASEYQYPVPQRFDDQDIVSYGYDDQILLFSEVKLPQGLALGSHTIKATAAWLACEVSCIPGNVELELPIEVGATSEKNDFGPLFDHFAAQHPLDPLSIEAIAVETALSTSAIRPNEEFKAAFLVTPIDPAKPIELLSEERWPTFTQINNGWDWWVNDVTLKKTDTGALLVVVHAESYEPDPLPTKAELGGLFQFKVGEQTIKTEIMRSMPWAATGTSSTPSSSALWQLAEVDTAKLHGAAAALEEKGEEPAKKEATPGSTPGAIPMGPGGILLLLLGGFAGGLLLNAMPCVLPVLTLKLYSLIEQKEATRGEQRLAGLAYSGGILVCFWVFAAAVIVVRFVFQEEVGWGFQFQYPGFVAALATIVFAFSLSLFGVFEVPAVGANQAAQAQSKEGPVGYFLTGIFAVLLATPCSAPFLGPALAFAFAAPTVFLVITFTMVGLGLAAPFLLIAFMPALYRLLPPPGAWMETFKQFLGFTLVATTVWLVSVLGAQIGFDNTIWYLVFLMFVAFGCWVFGRWGGLAETGMRQISALLVALVITVAAGVAFLDFSMAEAACDDGSVATELDFEHEIPWQPFSEDRVEALRGQTVFIDFTADWCWSCKVNERVVLETQTIREAMRDNKVVPLKADWTRKDEVITKWLKRFGKIGVPLYVVIPADGDAEPIVLPEVITTTLVVDAIEEG
ncbi:MAG: hypothetical protein HN348_15455, partial [Proteobacteria bacterium]|nr:hypothetical protein [Pseudomonadota bacterium]